MEFQIQENEQGIRNLYFGHPFSRETYTNSFQLRTPVESWSADFDGVYSGDKIELVPDDVLTPLESCDELRIVRGTKSMFIGDFSFVQEMQGDIGIYHTLQSKAMVKLNNPNYLDFSVYTDRILHDPLMSIDEVKSLTSDKAKKYMEYAVKYDNDKQYSDKLIQKPYFTTCPAGILILTEDFVDYNINLQVDPESGVIGCTVWMSESTSKYTKHYKEL